MNEISHKFLLIITIVPLADPAGKVQSLGVPNNLTRLILCMPWHQFLRHKRGSNGAFYESVTIAFLIQPYIMGQTRVPVYYC